MKNILFIFILCCSPIDFLAQKEDYNWITGGFFEPDSAFANTQMNFSGEQFQADLVYKFNPFRWTNSSISDSSGNLLCYTNGVYLFSHNHQKMLSSNAFQDVGQYGPLGYGVDLGALLLPLPGTDGKVVMLDGKHHNLITKIVYHPIRYTLADMSLNNGLGKVILNKIEQDEPDTFNVGQISACRHANGRDWWILLQKDSINEYATYRLTPEGLVFDHYQTIGETLYNSAGQSVFSPDGRWYAFYGNWDWWPYKTGLYLYRFDRCTGLLSEPLFKQYEDGIQANGAAISPNSRFLYVSQWDKVLQYDLLAPDILASETVVAEYDGFLDERDFPTRFYKFLLAPDGRLYGNIPNYNSRYLHVIDQPDLPGDSCTVIQHAVFLPTYNTWSLPNVPFYRLYDEQGSPCDTLYTVGTKTFLDKRLARVRVWPVPAADVLYFSVEGEWPDAVELWVFDALGRPVLTRPGLRLDPVATVRLDGLPAGAYHYVLRQRGRAVQAGKVVKTP